MFPKLIALASKIKWMPDVKDCQILCVDNGIEYLNHCFPENTEYFHLPVRGEVIYIRPELVFYLVRILVFRKKYGLGLRGAYIAAVAKYLEPSVIVTMIDNNNWDTNLSAYTGIPIVCTANGLRHPSHFPKKDFYCDFSMNGALTDPVLSFSNSFEEIHPVGHIKMGIFFERHGDTNFTSLNSEDPVLLWISQYRESIYNGNSEIDREQKATELMGLKYLSKYATEHGYRQRVAIASARKKADKGKELDQINFATEGRISYSCNNTGDWDSYEEVKNADLIIGMFSTLLFESLSVGKRVLFVLPDQRQALKQFINQSIRLDLLSPLVCSTGEYSEFSNKCSELLSLSDREYLDLISSFKDEVACFDKNTLPHHHVRNKLKQIIST